MARSESKHVLRRMMNDKLPDRTLRRAKVGFDIPIHDWLRGVLKPLLLDTLCEGAVTASGLFRWPAVQRLLREHLERRANWGYHLWGLMVLLMWMRRWRIEPPSAGAQLPGQVAETIAAMSQPSLLAAKEAVNRSFETSLAEGVRFERRVFHALFATKDRKEGMAAFIEKRPPPGKK